MTSEASHHETDHGSTEGRDSLFEAEKRESDARQGYQESSRRDDGQHLWTQDPQDDRNDAREEVPRESHFVRLKEAE